MGKETLTSKTKKIFKGPKFIMFFLLAIFIVGIIAIKNYNSTYYEGEAKKLMKYKITKVEYSNEIQKLLECINYGDVQTSVDIGSGNHPYIEVSYDFGGVSVSSQLLKTNLRNNAAVMFALIEYTDYIKFNVTDMERINGYYTITFNRGQIDSCLAEETYKYGQNPKKLQKLLKEIYPKAAISQEIYNEAMITSLGIRISNNFSVIYNDMKNKRVKYVCEHGSIYTVKDDGAIKEWGKEFEENHLEQDGWIDIYWSPKINGEKVEEFEKSALNVSLINKNGDKVDEDNFKILNKDGMYMMVRDLWFKEKELKIKNDSRIELYSLDKEDASKKELVAVINEDDAERRTLVNAIINGATEDKVNEENYDCEICVYKDGQKVKSIRLNTDSGEGQEYGSKECTYKMSEENCRNIKAMLTDMRSYNNLIYGYVVSGTVKEINESDIAGYSDITFTDYKKVRAPKSIIDKYNIKLGNNIKIDMNSRGLVNYPVAVKHMD